ncbi:MAG TPA: LytTR family DNA-binding domain-containing protein [Gammaproteobacteria bacterium]|nr:LytTR family DNA-binding domain-containing protein [Gammaproteobacteria bacterium]
MPRILVVDDEPLARERLRALLAELAAGEVVGEAGSGLEALALAARERPDVVLLDIRMPGMDGLEAALHLARCAPAPAVIFTTAYDEHALAAFEAQAIDYLLKPIRPERLRAALAKAEVLTLARATAAGSARGGGARARTHFSALVKGNLKLVPLAEVRYLQADRGYVSVFHPGGELLIEEALKALEEELGDAFLRIHRNTLVAVAQVSALERDALGNASVVLRGVAGKLAVSRRLLAQVRKRLRA